VHDLQSGLHRPAAFCLALPHDAPDVARDALLATHGGLSLAWCAVIGNIAPMALYRWFVPWSAEPGGRVDAVWIASAGLYLGR